MLCFLTKLTNTQVAQTLQSDADTGGRVFVFSVPFALVRQMVLDSWKREKPALLACVLGGAGVSLAGNMHYVVIGKLLPWIREIFSSAKRGLYLLVSEFHPLYRLLSGGK